MKAKTIKEIKNLLQDVTDPADPILQTLRGDERKGVQAALKSWDKAYQSKQATIGAYQEKNAFENQLRTQGYTLIGGVDEVGRGPLAGPVVAACVVFGPQTSPIYGLDDSKKLSLKVRLDLYEQIMKEARAIGIGIISPQQIDHLNIYQATREAMKKAVLDLGLDPDFLLVDAMTIPVDFPQESLVKGDARSNSIAAASIIAKVSRDKLMADYDQTYPGYGFAKNVGYGTKEHLQALENLGVTPIHRKSFAPIKDYL